MRRLASIAFISSLLVAACMPAERPITENQEPIARLRLPDEARVGDKVLFSGEGTRDLDGAIVEVTLEPGDESAPLAASAKAPTFEHTYDAPGLYTVALIVTDDQGLVGRARKPLWVLPADVVAEGEGEGDAGEGEGEPALDTDGDGLLDVDDAAPTVFNGLALSVFSLDTIPRDLLDRQMAEDVVAAVEDAAPVAELVTAAGFLEMPSSNATLATHFADAPALSVGFTLVFDGEIAPPAGAAALVVETGADDLAVVFVDGAPVASADEEYATNFLRTERVPATSAPLPLFGPAAIRIVLANEDGPYSWQVRLRFLDGDGTVLSDAPPQSAFVPSTSP